ncbi:hypothetical protein [Pseudomonas saudiphocaensis]|uniref:hypothetical protein n=1 Tax=Pseudomonas saudiphocaensis TaxID=1499686 RepID=UPI00187D4E8B|nr:hypothetical protein [Pseudomonas saudiphocaensis]MBE7927813.1 hypothetical protein [Pseudomonas saudiphocaensis]
MFSDQMIVLTYVIRSDSEQRGYNPWLRTVDNPFFNSVPKIALYQNWKLAGGDVTSLPWTHFDLLHPAKGVDPMDVFQVPVVAEFAANWSRLWGVDPAAEDQSVNYQIHILERVRQGKCRRGELVALVIDPDLEQLPADAEVWRTRSMVVGDNQLGETFALQPLALTEGKVDSAWGRRVLVGDCIASPQYA